MRGMSEIPVFRITAKHGKGVKRLLDEAVKAAHRNSFELSTGWHSIPPAITVQWCG